MTLTAIGNDSYFDLIVKLPLSRLESHWYLDFSFMYSQIKYYLNWIMNILINKTKIYIPILEIINHGDATDLISTGVFLNFQPC